MPFPRRRKGTSTVGPPLNKKEEEKKKRREKEEEEEEEEKRRRSLLLKKKKWSCIDSCCWTVGLICCSWWFMLFLYNAMPASFPQFVTEAITGPLPDPPGVKLHKQGFKVKHPVVFIPGIVTGGLELWEGHQCADGLFRKRLWGGTFGELYKRIHDVNGEAEHVTNEALIKEAVSELEVMLAVTKDASEARGDQFSTTHGPS